MFSGIECTYSTYPLHRVPTQLTSCDLWENLLCWALSHVCMSVIHVYIYYNSTCSMNVIVFFKRESVQRYIKRMFIHCTFCFNNTFAWMCKFIYRLRLRVFGSFTAEIYSKMKFNLPDISMYT